MPTTTVKAKLTTSMPDDWRHSVTLLLPNDTRITIEGDSHIIKQVADHLNGMDIVYAQINS